jgi:hypothetical protein
MPKILKPESQSLDLQSFADIMNARPFAAKKPPDGIRDLSMPMPGGTANRVDELDDMISFDIDSRTNHRRYTFITSHNWHGLMAPHQLMPPDVLPHHFCYNHCVVEGANLLKGEEVIRAYARQLVDESESVVRTDDSDERVIHPFEVKQTTIPTQRRVVFATILGWKGLWVPRDLCPPDTPVDPHFKTHCKVFDETELFGKKEVWNKAREILDAQMRIPPPAREVGRVERRGTGYSIYLLEDDIRKLAAIQAYRAYHKPQHNSASAAVRWAIDQTYRTIPPESSWGAAEWRKEQAKLARGGRVIVKHQRDQESRSEDEE